MEQLLPFLPYLIVALACPISMGVMMWYMMRDGHGQMNKGSMTMTTDEHLAMLRAQKDALEKQIRAAEDMRELQARRDALAKQITARQNGARG
ncbi:MAG: DUF2933 domain-containing protein [Chloroflexi bacterium]|nr:DUF2933 domain-containing protein [Chloroflexota bacterium]